MKFNSPYVQYNKYNGFECEIIRTLDHETENMDFDEVGEIYEIKLENGDIIKAWPEEIGLA